MLLLFYLYKQSTTKSLLIMKVYTFLATISLFFIFSVCQAQDNAPNPDFIEKITNGEQQAWLKKIQFAESKDYANYDLTFQRMEWEVDPAVHFIQGAITSYFHPLVDDFTSIRFDAFTDMQIDSVVYHEQRVVFSHEDDQLTISFPAAIPIQTTDSLTIWYQADPPSVDFGSFATTSHNGSPILWTLSEPYGAMTWWPCKQSLVDKIDSIEVHVTCPEGNKVASNGKLISTTTQDGKTTVLWKHHYPIATYLVAIAVTNYEEHTVYLKQDEDSIEILNYVYPSYLETAKTKTADMLDIMSLYNELFGQYPFANEKYGHAQFGWSGGMEHQTMSFMYYLNFELVAHEMAHQWFGDCITLGSWQNIWLNEGFATYLTGLCYENLLNGTYWNQWKTQQINKITSSSAGSVFVTDTTNINTLFSSRLSYSKGAYLLHMLRWELGDDAFFDALRNYFNDPEVKYGFASQEKLVEHLEAAGDTTLTEFFEDWYKGEGYPTYQISHFTDDGDNGKYKVTISQATSDESVDFFEMHVPLRVWKDNNSTDLRLHQTTNPQTFVLNEKPDSIQFDPDLWLISKGSVITSNPELATNKFVLYPNPVRDQLSISLPSNEQIEEARILDTNGRLTQTTTPTDNQFDVRSLVPGLYFIQLKTNKGTYRQSFVKAE